MDIFGLMMMVKKEEMMKMSKLFTYTYCHTCKKESLFSYGTETDWQCTECEACYSMQQLDLLEKKD